MGVAWQVSLSEWCENWGLKMRKESERICDVLLMRYGDAYL